MKQLEGNSQNYISYMNTPLRDNVNICTIYISKKSKSSINPICFTDFVIKDTKGHYANFNITVTLENNIPKVTIRQTSHIPYTTDTNAKFEAIYKEENGIVKIDLFFCQNYAYGRKLFWDFKNSILNGISLIYGDGMTYDLTKKTLMEIDQTFLPVIVNNCTTTSDGFALDARQGRVIYDLIASVKNVFFESMTEITDANDAPYGISFGNGITNSPTTLWCTYITIGQKDVTSYKQQFAISWSGKGLFLRNKDNGTWGQWKSITLN